ncbi:MAG: hypothetical protein H6814_05775 [Phycisphaeraceae bacterium]|nr:hypothetical protein [Phycisphaeraceae bacterium]
MRRNLILMGALAVAGALTTSANAGVAVTNPTIIVTAGAGSWEWNINGQSNGDGSANYDGSRTEAAGNGTWTLDWNINATEDNTGTARASQTAFLFNNIVLTNNTGMLQTVTVTTMIPIAPAILPGSLMGGSASGTLTTNGDGGSMSNVNNADPMYRALIDALAVGGVADLHNFDSSVSVVGFGSQSTGFEDFGTPIPSAPGPAVLNSIGITLQFDLTPGDSASWTSNFVVNVIPTPGAGAVLGMAGVLAFRRRR